MNNRTLLTALLVFVAAGLLFAASPAAAQTADGDVNLTIQPSSGEAPNGGVQTYDVVVVGPDTGIGAYNEVNITLANSSAADITSFTEARANLTSSKIGPNNATVSFSTALLEQRYTNQSQITIGNFTVTSTSSAGASTAIEYNQSADQNILKNDNLRGQNEPSTYNITSFKDATFTTSEPTPVGIELRPTESNVRLNQNTTVQVVASNVTNGIDSYNIDVSLNESAAAFQSVELLGNVTSDNTVLGSSSANLDVSLDGTGSGELVLANLTVQFSTNASASEGVYARDDGTASATVTQASVLDSSGSAYSTVRTNTTVSAVGPPAIGGRYPADPDNDGLYEDLTGFGNAVTAGDVQLLFNQGVSNPQPSLTKYAGSYNFATGFGGPQITSGDIQKLFTET